MRSPATSLIYYCCVKDYTRLSEGPLGYTIAMAIKEADFVYRFLLNLEQALLLQIPEGPCYFVLWDMMVMWVKLLS